MKFYDLYVNNLVNKEQIHSFIEVWHNTDFGFDYELHDFLGMTKEQYNKWVETDEIEII